MRSRFNVRSVLFVWALVGLGPRAAWSAAGPVFPPLSPAWQEALLEVRGRLQDEGLTEEQLRPLQVDELLYVDRAVELKMLSRVQPARKSATYYNERSFRRAQAFMREHRTSLTLAEHDYGVSPSIVAAILWIETHYGDFQPRYPTLSTAASLAVLSVPRIARAEAERARSLAREKRYAGWDEVDWEARAGTIGDRWYHELKLLLELNDRMGWPDGRLQQMKGSWAAAIGYGQFLPSTAVRNLDCGGAFWRADLWNWTDTIQLVAKHVSENGWSRDGDPRARRESILRYNRLESYADAVLQMSSRLEESSP